MSIVSSLKRLFDPIEFRAERIEQKRKQKTPAGQAESDPPSEKELLVCSSCGGGNGGQGPAATRRMCLTCLTPTMEVRR